MRNLTAVATLVVAVGLAACGSKSQVQSNPQVQQDVTRAEKIFQHCVPDPLVLRLHAGRKRAVACMVPAQNRVPFEQCLTSGIFHGIPTQARIVRVSLACVGKYA